MEEILVSAVLIIQGCVCIGKGIHSILKAKRLKLFLQDEETVHDVEGVMQVIKVEYRGYHGMDNYVVKINFRNISGKMISIIRSFDASFCSTRLLRRNKKKNEVPLTIAYERRDPENCYIKELKIWEHLRSEGWLMPIIGVALILFGDMLVFRQFR